MRKKEALTKTQENTLEFIINYRKENGFSPTYAELGAGLGVSDSSAFTCVLKLERKGHVKRSRMPRMLKVL